MQFVVGDLPRQAFGFANPNHAAAAICALFPFCWGWRGGWRWCGGFRKQHGQPRDNSNSPIFRRDPLGNVSKICYNTFNTQVSTTDANGIVTKNSYNEAGLVTRRKRLDGSETLTSLGVAYDAVGRLVREGSKTYRYGYLDKVLSVTDGDTTRTYTYHADGQLAAATVGGGHRTPRTPSETETVLWNGLALIPRGDEQFINEPHVGNAPQKLCFGGEPRAKRRAGRARKGHILGQCQLRLFVWEPAKPVLLRLAYR